MIQFAKAKGAKVIVSSRSKDKQQQALKIGADIAVDTDADWNEALMDEKIDLVIDSVGAATFNKSLSILKKGGKMVVFGATAGDTVDINLRAFFYGQYQLLGSTMGSREELRDMLKLVEEQQIRPVISETFHLSHVQDAFSTLEGNTQFVKIAIHIA